MKIKEKLLFLVITSRPRFWSYTFGTFLVGFFLGLRDKGVGQLLEIKFLVFLLFFTFLANLFVYGVNDLADEDTDKHNQKKNTHENLLKKEDKKILIYSLVIVFAVVILLALSIEEIRFWLIAFMTLGAMYSLPPFRFKMRPFIDSISNIFYLFPAIIGYLLNNSNIPDGNTIYYLFLFPIAMHLYSAIPDIEADKKAKLKTTAVILGKDLSLIVCNILWLVFSLSIINTGNYFPWSFALLIYPLLPLLNLNIKSIKVERTYWYFPLINFIIGFGFCMLLVYRLYN